MIYNNFLIASFIYQVVVGGGNRMIYNYNAPTIPWNKLWFDDEIEGYTTFWFIISHKRRLWFDDEIEGYTTLSQYLRDIKWLWFDDEIEGYTTICHSKGISE